VKLGYLPLGGIPYCVVAENIQTPPTEGIGISWGLGSSMRPKHLKKCMKLKRLEISRGLGRGGGGWGCLRKTLP